MTHMWHKPLRAAVIAAIVCSAGAAGPASAQTAVTPPAVTVHVGTGWGQLWDDETNLGTGTPLASGAAVTVGQHLRLGADVDWLRHTRDEGALRVDGDAVGLFARATYIFGDPASRVRPLAGAGIGLLRSSARLAFEFGDRLVERTTTNPAYDLHGGVRVAIDDRLAVRPEFRWRATLASGQVTGGELPFIGLLAVVSVDLRLGR